MGGGAPAAALVVAAALRVLATIRCARGGRPSLARPPRLCALSARLPPLAQMAARSGRKRLRARRGGFAAPPCCRLRPSFVGSGGGWSLGGALAIKKGANVARVPSLPARRPARARVRQRGKQRWGGLRAPSGGFAAAAPPPPPPVLRRGRGLWLSCVRCGGAGNGKAPLAGRFCYLTSAAFLLSHLVTQSAQEMSPVMFRQVRPMSNRRSTP